MAAALADEMSRTEKQSGVVRLSQPQLEKLIEEHQRFLASRQGASA
jgi:hypothetical protein